MLFFEFFPFSVTNKFSLGDARIFIRGKEILVTRASELQPLRLLRLLRLKSGDANEAMRQTLFQQAHKAHLLRLPPLAAIEFKIPHVRTVSTAPRRRNLL